MKEDDLKDIMRTVCVRLDSHFSSKQDSEANQIGRELRFTELLQSLVEYGNKNILKNFQFRVLMEDETDGR